MQHTSNAIHAGLTAIMGWLGLYFDMQRDVFATDKAFSYMAGFAPAHTWAVMFLLTANIGVVGLVSANAAIALASALVVATGNGIFAGCLIMSAANVWSGTFAIIAAMGYVLAYRRAHAGL